MKELLKSGYSIISILHQPNTPAFQYPNIPIFQYPSTQSFQSNALVEECPYFDFIGIPVTLLLHRLDWILVHYLGYRLGNVFFIVVWIIVNSSFSNSLPHQLLGFGIKYVAYHGPNQVI